MKHASTRALYDYWNRLRGSQPAPERSDIEPGDIRGILGDTFILEAVARDNYRFRLAGTRMCAAYCRELKGRDFLRTWSVQDVEAMSTMLAAITDDAAAAVLGVEGRTDRNQTVDMEMILLPLRMRGEGFTRILGACAPMEKPYWIGMHPITSQAITSLRLIWPDEQPYFLRTAAQNQAQNQAQNHTNLHSQALAAAMPLGLEVEQPQRRRVGHLMVYEGGKS